MAQNLDAGNNCRLEAFNLVRHWHIKQQAIHTITNLEFVLERFKVNVRRPHFNGITQYLIYKADDRGIPGSLIEICLFQIAFINNLKCCIILQGIDGICPDPEATFDLPLNGLRGGKNRLYVQAAQRLQRFQSLWVEQATGGHLNSLGGLPQWQELLLDQDTRRKQGDRVRLNLERLKGREFKPVFLCQPLQSGLFRRQVCLGFRRG